ncbi:MAG TPA: MerR family transcriptional regulator [Actinomycetota bacterium]|nr:MerR family transcriptional regulator [Actinomycetota bacterium]
MRYRVDELAAQCGVSVDTVRFYQARGLVPPGTREGRVAWYSEEHRQRLGRIRDLKEKGFSLATIRRLLAGELDAADEALAGALAGPLPGDEESDRPETLLTLDEFAEATGIPQALIQVIERQGLLVAPAERDGPRYTSADVRAASAGIALLEAGLPLDELLALAKDHDRAARATAERAVELFDSYVRTPIRSESKSEAEAAERLVEAFRTLLPATTRLVAHHFRRTLLAAARARFEGPRTEEPAEEHAPDARAAEP